MAADKPSRKRTDDLKRKVEGWLKSRSNFAEASEPDFQFVFSTTHGDHTVFVGLTKEQPDQLVVLYQLSFPEDIQKRMLEVYPTNIEYSRFEREVGRDMMESGIGYQLLRNPEGKLVGVQMSRVLYPFDEPGLVRQDMEDAIQNVVLPAIRVIYYLTDVLGLPPGKPPVTEPSQPFGPGKMFG